jgi:hypothetical protein
MLATAMFVAALAAGATPASAVVSGWMLNNKTLAEEKLTSAAVGTTPRIVTEGGPILAAEGGEPVVACSGVTGTAPEIKEVSKFLAKSAVFTSCNSIAPLNCDVPATIGTVPIVGEATLEGELEDTAIVKPESGTVLVTIHFTGEACAISGVKAVTGDVEVLLREGQDERTRQEIRVRVKAASGLLRFASQKASLEGTGELLLANNQPWSFL